MTAFSTACWRNPTGTDFPARKAEAAKRGKLRGIGLSCYIEACGVAPSSAVGGALGCGVGMWEMAEIKVNPVGTIEVMVGTLGHGQGHGRPTRRSPPTASAFPIGSMSVIEGDPARSSRAWVATARGRPATERRRWSRALDKVEAKAKKIAAHLLEAARGTTSRSRTASSSSPAPDKKLALTDVALAAYTFHKLPKDMEPGLDEKAYFDPTDLTYPAGAFVCEVEIDPKTGATEIVQFSAVDDFGNVINPMIVEGQVHGGIVHGLGQALLEEAVYESNSGQLLAGSYMDYCMPRAHDLPTALALRVPVDADAVQSAGGEGLRRGGRHRRSAGDHQRDHRAPSAPRTSSMPATTEKVWRTIQKTNSANKAA